MYIKYILNCLHNSNPNKMNNLIKQREEWRKLNSQINQQLKSAGVLNSQGTKIIKPLNLLPQSEWKSWIIELIKYRDSLTF